MTSDFLIYDNPPVDILDVLRVTSMGCILTGYVLNLVLVLVLILYSFHQKKKKKKILTILMAKTTGSTSLKQ